MPLQMMYTQCKTVQGKRTVINLDGTWDLDEGLMNEIPGRFRDAETAKKEIFNIRTVQVPGLVDLAQPPLANYGWNASRREAFWYHRRFRFDEAMPDVAVLKVHKARYGTKVFVNGTEAGEHLPNLTPGYFDIRGLLNKSKADNSLIIRTGAFPDSVPANIVRGGDSEMLNFIPGIYDSVELILSGTPHITNIQVTPDMESSSVRVAASICNKKDKQSRFKVKYVIREWAGGKTAAESSSEEIVLKPFESVTCYSQIQIRDCKCWSPENPFLYEIEVDTETDTAKSRFGMRSFRFDKATKRAMLNGKPYYMRGANVCSHRFFEDPLRKNLPWNEEWVRKLHTRFREMNWNSLRYTIGFPPEMWYNIADETGFLVQDEFPLWYSSDQGVDKWPDELKAQDLAKEYDEWIQERCNHPCVVIWNAANETRTDETGKAIELVKEKDMSGRPWGNSWGNWQDPEGAIDAHTYLFIDHIVNEPPNVFKLSDLARISPVPRRGVEADLKTQIACDPEKPIFVNEYGWLWLNRDGTPTTLTQKLYKNLLGENASSEERRICCARLFASLTEFWRCHRKAAGIIGPFGLCHSRPDGRTCDHFKDIVTLEFEPYFREYVGDAFSPVALMVDEWAEVVRAGERRQIKVVMINDTENDWTGHIGLEMTDSQRIISTQKIPCTIDALGHAEAVFDCVMPEERGRYQIIGSLLCTNCKPIRSLREIIIA